MMVPPALSGEIISVKPNGKYHLEDEIAVLRDEAGPGASADALPALAIRTPRPVQTRLPAQRPLITGQRVIDTLFPIAKGGAAAIPGGFGTGKTMTQHQLAKWCDADIIIYVGCGERGNEMTQGADGVQRASRSEIRSSADGPYRFDCQHLQHACGGA